MCQDPRSSSRFDFSQSIMVVSYRSRRRCCTPNKKSDSAFGRKGSTRKQGRIELVVDVLDILARPIVVISAQDARLRNRGL